MVNQNPEQIARDEIDDLLKKAGWAVQDKKKIGDFPLMDFFLNAKIKTFRVFLKYEHFNSSFSGYNYFSAPSYPYRDAVIRFGVIWDFFS